MNKLASILSILIVLFTACDKVKDLNTKTFEGVKLSNSVLIEVEDLSTKSAMNSAPGTFREKLVLNLNEASAISDYLNHIEDIAIDSFTCKLKGVENGIITSLNIHIPHLDYNIEISPLTTEQDIAANFSAIQLRAIAETILEDKELEMLIEGSSSIYPINFTVEVSAVADVLVEIL